MATKNVTDAVNALFVRCIASENSLKTFQHAASLVHRMARAPRQACWEHLAVALDEQVHFLRMLRTNDRRANADPLRFALSIEGGPIHSSVVHAFESRLTGDSGRHQPFHEVARECRVAARK